MPDNVSPFFTVYCSISLITRIWSGCIVVDFMLFISINSSTVMLCCLEIPHKVSPLCTSTSAAETLDTVTPANRIPVATEAANFFISHVPPRSEEHTSELQSRGHIVCRLLLEKKNNDKYFGSNTSI